MKKQNQPVRLGQIAKVPMVMQMEALECGAASLDMILGYYGRFVPLSRMRKECGVSRDGSNLKSMALAAQNYGLKYSMFRMSTDKLLEKATFPCIIFWEYNHFVVLTGVRKNKFYLNDPGRGVVAITRDEFDKSYARTCMFLEPGESFEPGGEPDTVFHFARKYLHGTRSMACFVLLTAFLLMVLGLLEPLFPRFFVDNLLGSRSSEEWVTLFFGAYFAVTAAKVLIYWLNSTYLLKMQGKMAVVANTRFIWHVLRLPMDFFSQRMPSDIMNRQRANASIASSLISRYVPLVLDLVFILFYLILMINYSPLMALIGIIAVILNAWISNIVSKKRINLSRIQTKNASLLSSTSLSGISLIETLKSAGCEDGFFEYWAGLQSATVDDRVKMEQVNQYLGQLPALLTAITENLILCMGVAMIIRGDWTIGIATAFAGYLTAFTNPVNKMINAAQSFQEMRNNMERISDVMDYPAAVPAEQEAEDPDRVYHKLSGEIEFKNVTFGYNPMRPPLIRDFSLKIEAGQSIALVGGSGSGKSTVAKLVTGLQKPWSGEILFDGKTIDEIPHSEFTASVSSVDQDISLFAYTVRKNITMCDPTVKNEAVMSASRDAQIFDDIMKRQNGFDTVMKEAGSDYSGGQRQRIEIARALASEPTIMILDEATSALDAETEYKVSEAIAERKITRLLISHRLSTVRDCDLILVLKDGEVIDRGRHEELMDRCEYYAGMITNQ